MYNLKKNLISFCTFLITFMFFVSSISKMLSYNKTVLGLQKRFPIKNLPFGFFKFTIICVIILQFLAPLVLVYNSIKPNYVLNILSVVSAGALCIFTILATLLYHYPPVGSHYYSFMSNITTTGALLLLAVINYNL